MRGRYRGVVQAFQEGAAWSGHDQDILAVSTAGTLYGGAGFVIPEPGRSLSEASMRIVALA
jgi:hypothetical protein